VLAATLAATLALSACPAGDDDGELDADPPAPSTTAVPAPVDAPLTAAPSATISARPAAPLVPHEGTAVALDMVGTPDGGARVLLGEPPLGPPTGLVTVSPQGAVSTPVAVPGLSKAWDLHALADGTVLVIGRLAEEDAAGYVRVDPRTGAVRAVAAVPLAERTQRVEGFSTLSDDGATVFLYVLTTVADRNTELIEGWDLGTDELLSARDLFSEMRGLAWPFVDPDPVGLAPLPDGGVALVSNLWQPDGAYLPILFPYDADLLPTGDPLVLAQAGSDQTARAMAPGAEGAVFVLLRGSPSSTLLSVTPDTGEVSPRIAVPGFGFTGQLVTDPDGRTALLTAAIGARLIDLTAGSATEVDVGCPEVTTVIALATTGTDHRAAVLGGCATDGRLDPTLWLVR
jgi:hypothetical protein